jgi:hypothetical protein
MPSATSFWLDPKGSKRSSLNQNLILFSVKNAVQRGGTRRSSKPSLKTIAIFAKNGIFASKKGF